VNLTLRTILLTLHILSAILLIGWLAMHAMLAPRLIRQGPRMVEAVRFSVTSAEKVGRIAPVVFLLGLWLAGRGHYFDEAWLGVSMVLFILALVIGAVFIGGAEKKALAKFEAGQPAPEEAKRVAMLGGINNVILLVIVYLMVAKP
jgi:hypothetical protein